MCEWHGCSGTGTEHCVGCGGDQCVCRCGGERECHGCELCGAEVGLDFGTGFHLDEVETLREGTLEEVDVTGETYEDEP
jgi:hypothetical protein